MCKFMTNEQQWIRKFATQSVLQPEKPLICWKEIQTHLSSGLLDSMVTVAEFLSGAVESQ